MGQVPKKPALDSKTDLCTTTDEHWHLVFKLPTTNFINLFKEHIGDFEATRELVYRLGCRAEIERIVGIDFKKIDDQYFGPGVMITVHEIDSPYQSRCHKCNIHFDVGES